MLNFRAPILVALLVAIAGSMIFVEPSFAATTCDELAARTTGCPVVEASNDGDGVTLRGSVDAPGGGDSEDSGGSSPDAPIAGPPVIRDGYTVTAPVRLSDLVNFRPNPGTDHMEPNGWMVVGLDTNFYARAARQVKTGELLGAPASVRFTPERYRWFYGDGTSATLGTPGSTWQSLGVNEFDATATSHRYQSSGTYFIDLTIGFSPEYRYDTDPEWTPIAGLVWVPANRLVAVAGTAKTVLVERQCHQNPTGPGC